MILIRHKSHVATFVGKHKYYVKAPYWINPVIMEVTAAPPCAGCREEYWVSAVPCNAL